MELLKAIEIKSPEIGQLINELFEGELENHIEGMH